MNKAISIARINLMKQTKSYVGIPESTVYSCVSKNYKPSAVRPASTLPNIKRKPSPKNETFKVSKAKPNRAADFNAHIETLPQLRFPSRYKVNCLSTSAEADEHIRSILKDPKECVFGLDLEWQPTFQKGGKEKKTALVQICGKKEILLIQVSVIKRIPAMLQQFLEDRTILKTGVNIRSDGLKMFRDFGIRTNGLVELSNMADASCSPKLQVTHLRSLRAFTAIFLNRNMPKGKVRLSNWSLPLLTSSQKFYAANDAYASYEIYQVILSIMKDQIPNQVVQTAIHHLEDQLPPNGEATKPAEKSKEQLVKADNNKALPICTTTIIRKSNITPKI